MPRFRHVAILCLGFCLPLLGGAPLLASPDLAKALNDLKRERDPERRQHLVRKLAALDGDRAAKALAEFVIEDPSAGVRISAARALARMKADDATNLLVGVARRGGPLAVRQAVGKALGRRRDGPAALRKALASGRSSRRDRALLLRVLGWTRRPEVEDDLRAWMQDADTHLASEAMRALLDLTSDEKKRRVLVKALLIAGRTPAQLMPALDAAGPLLDPSLERALRRAATFLEPCVKDAADHLLDALAALPAPAPPPKAEPGPDDRYGTPEAPPTIDGPSPVPVTPGRSDIFYVLDATGSTDATLPALKERILRSMRTLQDAGMNARVGVLLYRGSRVRERARDPFEALPLTYDIEELRAWLDEVEPGGVDDRGLRLGQALENALARSAWRAGAARRVHLIADGPCGDIAVARRAVTIHYRADRTRTLVTYVARTRGDLPAGLEELARLGGTTAVELVE